MFDLSDYLPVSVRGVTVPSGRYLIAFADYLNEILVLSANPEAFKRHFRENQYVHATDQAIDDALQVSYT